MNIYTQVCGLFIVLLLLIFYKKQPTIGLETEKKYIYILYAVLGCVVSDIGSVILITNSEMYSYETITMIGKLYLISIFAVTYLTLAYEFTEIQPRLPKQVPNGLQFGFRMFAIVVVLFILFHPLYFVHNGNAVYSYGPACTVTYICCFFTIVTTLIGTYKFKRYINPKRRQALQLWMYTMLVFAFIQFFNPKILIVSFGCCLGAMITYFELENPESNISRNTGLFSATTLKDYFDYLYKKEEEFSVLMFAYSTTAESSIDTKTIRKAVDELNTLLYDFKDGKVFTTAEGFFIMVFDAPDKMMYARKLIDDAIAKISNDPESSNIQSLLRPYYIDVPESCIANSSLEILSLINDFIPTDFHSNLETEVTIDEAAVQALYRKKEIEDMVVDALENDRVEVYYQPIYCVEEGIYTSAEALVRIRLQDGTLVNPGSFIPIAEDTGRIMALSDAIFKKTFSFMRSYRLTSLGIKYLELNLSIRQGEDPFFPNRFSDALNKYGLSAASVNLEITETASLKKKDMLMHTMNKLKENGCNFSLDDFGSGSSNLSYIIDMPIDVIKFDKDLTSSYFHSDKARAVVTAVTDMAHSMGIRIVAEGIETESQYKIMADLGIDYIQGYYFSKPLPEKDFIRFLQQNNLKPKSDVC